jgi:EAL domain-containing protein (putative c-di-GMP-specific phosphodiesterase class I)
MDSAAAGQGLHPIFQPIVSLPDGATVGFEALARWTQLPNTDPEAVFMHSVTLDREQQLEQMCINMAIESALGADIGPEPSLFINCQPNTPHVDRAHNDVLARGAEKLQLIFEITERSLRAHPAALLRKVAALRSDGFAVALDDVGACLDSLALLDVIAPDVIKLDLALVQSQPHYQQARTWAAVLAHHERAGAILLAEGIESAEHLQRALSLGATLGQGFMYGNPGPLDDDRLKRQVWSPPVRTQRPRVDIESPFDAEAGSSASTRTERKDTVLALSRYLEQQALDVTDTPMVLAALQRAEFFCGSTQAIYQRLGATSPLVAVFGQGLSADLGSGVRGVTFDSSDPLSSQWIVLTLGATVCTALIAREHDDHDQPGRRDGDRRFELAITNDRSLVTTAAHYLLSRMR